MDTHTCLSILLSILFVGIVQSAIPYGCECENRNVDINDCVQFDCKCICDLTSQFCDYNCYCDPDCSDDEKSRFTDRLPEVKPKKYLPLCSQLDYNSEDPFQVLYNAMCITRDNNPSKGEYYVSNNYVDTTSNEQTPPAMINQPNSIMNISSGGDLVKLPVASASLMCDFYYFKFLNSESNNARNCYLLQPNRYLDASFYKIINMTDVNITTNADSFDTDFPSGTNIVNKVEYNFTIRNNESNFIIELLNITIYVIESPDPQIPINVEHQVIYTIADDAAINTTQSPQQKSGNPGYINGLPVITNLETSTLPLPLPSLSDGGCTLNHDLLFNENYFTICKITVNDVQAYALDYMTQLENYITTSETMIAKYGNSDFNSSLDEFFNITIEQFENVSRIPVYCVIVKGVHYEFLTTSSGRHGNPQNTIFGARLRFSHTQVPCEEPYELNLEVSATFMYINEKKLSNYLSRLPNIIMDLIYTWFEPFFYKSYDPNKL